MLKQPARDTRNIDRSEGAISGAERIFFRRHRPAQGTAKKKALVLHGFNDHSGRYTELLDDLAAAGFDALAPDLRGQGQSSGARGMIRSFSDYLDDALLGYGELTGGSGPITLFGHSVGGVVAMHFALAHSDKTRLLVLDAPYLGRKIKANPVKLAAGHVLGRLLPAIALPSGLSGSLCTHDPARLAEYDNDPYNYPNVRAGWFVHTERAMAEARNNAVRLQMPIYWYVGELDPIADFAVSKAAFDRVESRDKTFVPLPGMLHEPLNEIERDRVRQGIVDWLARHEG